MKAAHSSESSVYVLDQKASHTWRYNRSGMLQLARKFLMGVDFEGAAYINQMCCRASCRNTKVSGTNVVPNSKFRASATLLLKVWYEKYQIRISFSAIMFVLILEKMDYGCKNWTGHTHKHTQRSYLKAYFFKGGIAS